MRITGLFSNHDMYWVSISEAVVIFKLEKYTEWIKDNLKEVPRENKEFFEADKICENFSMDEQLRLQNSKIAEMVKELEEGVKNKKISKLVQS